VVVVVVDDDDDVVVVVVVVVLLLMMLLLLMLLLLMIMLLLLFLVDVVVISNENKLAYMLISYSTVLWDLKNISLNSLKVLRISLTLFLLILYWRLYVNFRYLGCVGRCNKSARNSRGS